MALISHDCRYLYSNCILIVTDQLNVLFCICMCSVHICMVFKLYHLSSFRRQLIKHITLHSPIDNTVKSLPNNTVSSKFSSYKLAIITSPDHDGIL